MPNLSIISPQKTTYTNLTQLLNISATDNIEISSVLYNYNGTNYTYTTPIYVTFNEGSNTLNVWANDTTGNWNYTSRVFTIDSTYPLIEIITPKNRTYNDLFILTNIHVNDTDTDKIWYNWNGTNYTYTSPIQIRFNLGSNTLKFGQTTLKAI
jgi:hypothetical protein